MNAKRTILIVDDDLKVRKTLSDILQTQGYVPIAAATGKAALDRVEEEMPVVALIDLRLEDISGLEVMRGIKERSPGTECIVLTGYATQKSAIEAVNLGAYSYVQKPYDMEQLLVTVRRAVERRESEEALRESEEKYRRILENIEEGYYEVDIAGNFTFFNDSLCRLLRYSEDELMGMNNRQYMDDESAKKVYQTFNAVYRTGEPAETFDWEVIRKDGTSRFVEASVSLISGPTGEPAVFGGIVRDITERKRAEEALREYSERLEEMVEERTKELRDAQEQLIRREKLAVIGQLGASMCHELRNPLGVINNSVYYLNTKLRDVDEKAKKHSKIMEREIASSNKIVSDLLRFAEGKKPILQKTQINTIVQDALSRTTVPDKVAVITDLGGDLPPLMADRDQIEQVFINLILNAVQATPNGGRLEISTRAKEGFIEVEFKDNGCGMPEEDLGRVFEPLFTTKARGIGLGLPVSRKIIEAHGGSIEVESEVGQGSTFTFTLPV